MKKIVIIPAFNEENKIEAIINDIKALDKDLKIVIVDDGSKDKTAFTADKAGATVLKLPFNLGYSNALQTGYKYAYENYFDVIVQMDADGQHDPRYIPEMINMLSRDKADVIVGSRFKTRTGYKTSFARRIGIVFFGIITSMIIRKKVTDPTSGYKAIDRKVLPFLISESFPNDYPDADLLIMLHYNGFKIEEFPMQMYQDTSDKSMHKGFLKKVYYIFKMLLSIFLIIFSIKIFKNRR